MVRRGLLFLSAMCVAAPGAVAAGAKWTAASTTAMAITGDITVEPDRVTFGNGRSIGLKPVAGEARLFTIEPPENPQLLNGNFICSTAKPPAFIALESEGGEHYLLAFDGPGVPKLAADPLDQTGVCALFTYAD